MTTWFSDIQGSLKRKLSVVFSNLNLQEQTFGAIFIKLFLEHLHKNDIKTTEKSSEAAAWRFPVIRLFLKFSQN